MTLATDRLRVAIVGCGIGGAAAATFLARQGHEVTVFEQSSELGSAGAGILVAPTGQFVLSRLGLLDVAVEHGSKVQRLAGSTLGGKEIVDLRYRDVSTGLFGLGIHRGTLFHILLQSALEEDVRVRTGSEALFIEGSFIRTTDGHDGPFDLIVVCDGARSKLRKQLGLERRARPYRYGALWVCGENWGEIPNNVLRQRFDGTRRMSGILPSGCVIGTGRKLASLFWSVKLPFEPINLNAWKDEVAAFDATAAPLLEQVESWDQVTVASYMDARPKRLVRDNVALLGDAAHASSPQLGQGASLALMDAHVLARCIAFERNVEVALLQYERLRVRHGRFYQNASRWMTPLYQSDAVLLGQLRDALSPALHRSQRTKREMAVAMCGFKNGPFSAIQERATILNLAARRALQLGEDPQTAERFISVVE